MSRYLFLGFWKMYKKQRMMEGNFLEYGLTLYGKDFYISEYVTKKKCFKHNILYIYRTYIVRSSYILDNNPSFFIIISIQFKFELVAKLLLASFLIFFHFYLLLFITLLLFKPKLTNSRFKLNVPKTK